MIFRRPSQIIGCIAVLGSLFLPCAVQANIGPKWWGDRTAEPLGLKGVAITHEKLTIDLRPLADAQPVEVEAIYHLNNTGAARKIELFFITGVASVRDFTVHLGDRALESRELPRKEWPGSEAELPPSWQPPADMPGIDSDKSRSHIYRLPSKQVVLAFSVELPPGRSFLRANYRAKAYGEDEDYPTVTWQFPYILAPAREWERFDGLDVTVKLPAGWQANSTPALERNRDVLHGRFASLPADCLALAARQPMEPALQRKKGQTIWTYGGLYALVIIGGGALCWWTGRLLGRLLARRTARRSSLSGLPSALLMPLLWFVVLLYLQYRTQQDITGLLGGQESPYFHEHFSRLHFGTFSLLPIVLVFGFFLTWDGFWRSVLSTTDSQKAGHPPPSVSA
jgi:hypothetical protein